MCVMSNGYGQSYKSDLRIKVESIIKHDINYVIDSTTDQLVEMKWDTTIIRGLYPAFSSFPSNPLTLIILDEKVITLEELDKYELSQVKDLHVYPREDETALAIYGRRAKNGLIVIHLLE